MEVNHTLLEWHGAQQQRASARAATFSSGPDRLRSGTILWETATDAPLRLARTGNGRPGSALSIG